MKTFISALALAGMASAHCTIWGISVNDKDQGFGNSQGGYIDTPPNNSPVTDVTSKAMECNVANIKASKSVNVNPGDEIAVQWYHNGPVAGDQIIDGSHKGPISVYMSKAGTSMSWTKIAEDGFDGKTWAVEKLRNGAYNGKKGQHTFKVPNVAAGEYVFRPEIIALHEGNRAGGAQFYMECIHVKVGGSGTAALPAGVAIPGYVTANTPGVLFDIYNPFTSYPIPGPKVWNGAGGAASPASSPAASAPEANAPAASSPAANPPATGSPSAGSPSAGSPAAGSPAAGSPSTGSPAGESPAGESPAAGSPAAGSPAAGSPAAGSPAAGSPAGESPAGESPAAGSPAGDDSAECTEGSDDTKEPAEPAAEPANPPTTPSPSGGATAQKFYQCGGQGYTGPTDCVSGTKCVKQNDWYFQCL